MSKFKDMAIENGDQQANEQIKIKAIGQGKYLKVIEDLKNELQSIHDIIMKYYPQDKEFTDIQSALVYLLEKRVEEIQNLAVKCDTLQEQLDMFKNGGVI